MKSIEIFVVVRQTNGVIRRSVDYTTNNEVFLILSHVYKNVLSFV